MEEIRGVLEQMVFPEIRNGLILYRDGKGNINGVRDSRANYSTLLLESIKEKKQKEYQLKIDAQKVQQAKRKALWLAKKANQ